MVRTSSCHPRSQRHPGDDLDLVVVVLPVLGLLLVLGRGLARDAVVVGIEQGGQPLVKGFLGRGLAGEVGAAPVAVRGGGYSGEGKCCNGGNDERRSNDSDAHSDFFVLRRYRE